VNQREAKIQIYDLNEAEEVWAWILRDDGL